MSYNFWARADHSDVMPRRMTSEEVRQLRAELDMEFERNRSSRFSRDSDDNRGTKSSSSSRWGWSSC